MNAFVRWAVFLSILFPAVVAFLYVREFGVSVVFRDQWEMVTYFRYLSNGSLTASEIWQPHNEHRFFFPRMVMLALGSATNWDNTAEMYLSLALLLVTMTCFLLAFREDVGGGRRLLLFIPVAFLVFSLRQYWNFLWGYQLTFILTQTFAVLALFSLHMAGRRKARFAVPVFAAALGSATVASLSSIQGLLIWPAGLIGLLIASMEKRAERIAVVVWASGGLAVWAIYFLDYNARRVEPSELLYPVNSALYYLRMAGGSLFFPQLEGVALVFGTLVIGLFGAGVFLLGKERRLGENYFWISVAAFSFLTMAAITAGRSEIGLTGSLTSRYTTFSILALVAVYVIFAKLALERGGKLLTPPRLAFAALLAVVSLSMPLSYYQGLAAGRDSEDHRREAARVLASYESQPDERLEILNPRAESVRVRAPILEDLGLNVFSEDP